VTGPAGVSLAAVVNTFHVNGSAASYEGVGAGSAQLHVPLLYKEANGWNSALHVQNLGTTRTQVTVTYTASAGPGQWQEHAFIAPGAVVNFSQPTFSQLPNGFVGSAVVTSNSSQPLVGIVNAVHAARGNALAYIAYGSGAPMLTAPFAARNGEGWSSGLQVQNLGAEPTNITLLLQDPDGVLLDSFTQTSVAPGAARTISLPALGGVPEGWRGSATVVSTTGAPLAAIVTETRY
jgi:hypothetical protein